MVSNVPSNQQNQFSNFLDNSRFLLDALSDKWVFNQIPDVQGINAYAALAWRVEEANNLWGMRKVQMDLVALDILSDIWYDFRNLESDLCFISWNETGKWMRSTDFFEILENYRRQNEGVTDVSHEYPQILKDAIISKNSKWEQPPAEEMQKAVIYFADKAFSSLQANPDQ